MNDTHRPSSTEERLRSCEAQLQAVFDDGPVPMGLVSGDGRFVRVNRRLAEFLGFDASALFGTPFQARVHADDQPLIADALREMGEGRGTLSPLELRLLHRDRRDLPVEARAACRAEHGAAPVVAWVFRDVRERRAAEERARYLAAIVDSSDDAIIGKTLDGIVTSWNRGAQAIYGYSAEEMIGRPLNVVAPEDLKGEIARILARIRAGERVVHHETRRRRKDGTTIFLSLTVSPVYDTEGRLIGASTVGRDITESRAVAARLRATADLLEKVFSSVHVQLAYLDRGFNFVKVNQAYASANGQGTDYFTGRNLFALHPDPDNEAVFRRVLETGEPSFISEREAPAPEGLAYWDQVVQPVKGPTGEVEGVVLSLLNVTERAQAKRRAEKSAAYAGLLIAANMDPLVTITLEGVLTDANPAFLAVTGRTREQVVGTHYTIHVIPVETARAGFGKALAEGEVRDVPLELRHLDGHTTPVLYNANLFRDETGSVAGVLAVARDISSLKRAEAEVARLNRWNKLVLDSAGEGIYGIDAEGRCTFANPAITKLLGYESPDEILGQPAHALFHHTRTDGRPYPIEECPAHRAYRQDQISRGADEVYWRKDGTGIPVEYVSTPIHEGDQVVGAVVTVLDITARKRAEGLLRLRAKEQEGIARLGLRALTGEPLDALMNDATRLVAESLEVELCKVLELLPGGEEVLLRAGVGWKEGCVGQAKVSTGRDSQAGYTLEAGEPVVVKDLRRETRFSGPPLLHEHGVVSGLSVVIPGREKPFGVMGAHTTREREFSADDVNFLQAVANVIAASVERAHAEERLRAASAYNRRLIEASLDPLVTIGADGTINDVNASTEAVTGRAREALIGTDFSTYFVDPDQARAGYEQVFREGFVRDYPLEIRHADGRVTPVLYNATVYRDEQGQVAGVFAAARDITARKRAEQALRESEARLKKAQEIAHLGSWELDLVSGVLVWSDEIFRIFEIDKAKFGASYEAFLAAIHPEDRALVDAAYTRSLKTRTPYSIDHRLLFPGGRIKYVHEQCETAYDNGRPLRSVGTVQDVTERRLADEALRQSEARYRSLFERMFDGYAVHEIVLDAAGRPCDYRFLEVNPAFERMTGLRRANIVGRRVTEVLPDIEPFWIETYGQVALTGQGRRFEQYAKVFDRDFEVAAFSPAPQQFATLFSDVTERRRAEEALHTLNRELEQRVNERTAALEAANRELESFAYSVSHDLRTPLRAIDGFSRLLLQEQEAHLDEDGKRLLRIVRENTEKMSQLISDILNFSRTGRAAMHEEPVSMRKLVQEVWSDVAQGQPDRRLELQLSELPDARGDRALLRQVWVNLLSNAAKFTRPRAVPLIEVGARTSPDEIVYYVKDNGVGFDMAYVEKLFGVFQRLHSAEEFEGTGIGLAIVKRIVSRHNGRVWAESTPDKGATFFFSLPRHESWTAK